MEHLGELRRRLIYVVAGVFLTTLACFGLAQDLFEWLRRPLLNLPAHKLIVLSPLEMFITYVKLAVLCAVFISAPWILVQIWLFISPGLYKHEKRWIVPFVVLGTAFFFLGGSFAFYLVMPLGLQYLVAMVPEAVEATYSVANYFSLVTRLLLAFGIVFEVPLLMWILAAAKIVSPGTFKRFRKFWVVIAVAAAAFLTPPDPLTQMMMAIPLVVFFEIGLIGARILGSDTPATEG